MRFTVSAMSLAAFLLVVAIAGVFGSRFTPGQWYEQLYKAPWTPPNWVFGPVWTLLYIAIAVAGWLVWREASRLSLPLALWCVQLVLNSAWSWLFFGRHYIGVALLDILLLGLAIAAFMVFTPPLSRLATWLFAPYAAWTLYAASLNFYAWTHNTPRGGA